MESNQCEIHMKKQQSIKTKPKIDVPRQDIENFCLNNHIQALALFGSVLTDRFRKTSDVDVLVQFESHHIPGLIRLSQLELELGEIFGRHVDLRTPKDLSRYFRDEVITRAYRLYGKERFHSS